MNKNAVFVEHAERARELSRDVNILDLEKGLTREMSTMGFARIYDADLTTVTCPETKYVYQGLEFMDMGHPYFREGFHDENDKLIYRNDGTTILIRKRRIQDVGYWEKAWGVDISFKYDLSDVPDLTRNQARTLPPNNIILSKLFSDEKDIGVGNAFGKTGLENSPIIFLDGNLVYHQYLGLHKQSGLKGKEKSEFITKVVKGISKIVFVNNHYVKYELKVRDSLEKHKEAFELILKKS
ncbi:MAG: hypothetical protein JSV92_01250 [archaeon]|nr:MAG: hypothetical protein JSV92_01250 [archaeon]